MDSAPTSAKTPTYATRALISRNARRIRASSRRRAAGGIYPEALRCATSRTSTLGSSTQKFPRFAVERRAKPRMRCSQAAALSKEPPPRP